MRVVSYGGGVQSTALLVLVAQGELQADALLFANVGDDSENPATLRYFREVALPYAERHGVPLIELRKTRRVYHHEIVRVSKPGDAPDILVLDVRRWYTQEPETLYGRLTQGSQRSIGIPVRLGGNGAPARRTCTTDFKVRLIARWCWQHGARPATPAVTVLGISLDEFERMRNDSGIPYTRLAYPLVDRRMTRQDCMNVIASAGLPIPPKSSCWFCPFHSLRAWRDMRDQEPALFAKAVALEATLSERAARIHAGRGYVDDKVYFTNKLKPLPMAVGTGVQPSLWADDHEDACESGFCMV
jgi:hypothetical protein